jgi:hypothetical protein
MSRHRLVVCICTYRRPDDLLRLLTRLHTDSADVAGLADVGVVVVDDDPGATAKSVIDTLDSRFPLGVHYAATASGNISVARNRAVTTGLPLADSLAFIDDDCLPDSGWLRQLLSVQLRTGCDIVSGCCQDESPPGSPKWLIDAPFLAGPLDLTDGAVIEIGALKNTLVTAEFLRRVGLQFDDAFGTAGGEDVMWFRAAVTAGATMRYAADAVVREIIPPSRTKLRYLLRRALWYGNTEVVTGMAVGAQSRRRMVLSGVKCVAGGALRPWRRLATRRAPQWRFAATELLSPLTSSTAGPFDDTRRHADCERTCRNVSEHDGVGPDHRAVADMDVTQQYRSGADVDPLAKPRSANGSADVADADRHVLANPATVVDLAVAADDDPRLVVDHHPTTETSGEVDLDAVLVANSAVRHPVHDGKWRTNCSGLNTHPPVAEPVDHQHPPSRREPVGLMGTEVLADQREQANARRIAVAPAVGQVVHYESVVGSCCMLAISTASPTTSINRRSSRRRRIVA